MSLIHELLERTLLLKEASAPSDVVPYQHDSAPGDGAAPQVWPAADPFPRDPDEDDAAYDLQTLCETLVTQTAAVSLSGFLTEHLPQPSGARILGCILHLADAEDGARFWWQYAAGAEDDAASYCLYLHHLALGETHTADWWRQQTRADIQPAPETVNLPGTTGRAATVDTSLPTVLRTLSRLLNAASRPRTEVVTAVMEYVPNALADGYAENPDFEIPLPGPHFAEHITAILAATARPHTIASFAKKTRKLGLRRRTPHSRANLPRPEDAARGSHEPNTLPKVATHPRQSAARP
ncbi:hypothetical protein ABZ721_40140 [Streptomyces sp. NPDC006733]|uniref:hypothetical protein n=1 Tax=Streptomyces sp. NPDC006733 TaxID=3155460 RepID=UPI003402A9CE